MQRAMSSKSIEHVKIRVRKHKRTRIRVLGFIVTLLIITLCACNVYYSDLGLNLEEENWHKYIDAMIFMGSLIILSLIVIGLSIQVFGCLLFGPSTGFCVFAYMLLWLIACIATLTSNFICYYIHLTSVFTLCVLLWVYTWCVTAVYQVVKELEIMLRLNRMNILEVQYTTGGCYYVPLQGVDGKRSTRNADNDSKSRQSLQASAAKKSNW